MIEPSACESATTASILVAMSGWTLALVSAGSTARLAWTSALFSYLLHVLFAFSSHYGWSHATALVETARQTAEFTGFESGIGLWVNYAFGAVLAFDVLQQWLGGRRRFASAIDGLVVFMIVNGAIVFADGAVRVYGVVLVAIVLGFRLSGKRIRARGSSAGSSSRKS